MQKKGSNTGTLCGVREIDVRTFAHKIMDNTEGSEALDFSAREIYSHYAMDEDELIKSVYPHLLIAAQFCQCRLPNESADEELLSFQLAEADSTLIVELLEEKGAETIYAMQNSSGALKRALQNKAERIEAALIRFN